MNKLFLIPALLSISCFAAAQDTPAPAPSPCCEAKNADGTPANDCCKDKKDCCKPAAGNAPS